jgi:hypothetical protein
MQNTQPPENDLEALAKITIFALTITLSLFFIFEVHNPYVEETLRYEHVCESKGGMVYEKTNEKKRCIKQEIIKIP